MAMDQLPGAVLRSEDAGDAETDRGEVVTTADLGSVALHFDGAGELVRDVLGNEFEGDDLALLVAGRRGSEGLDS